jgi:hypothetical protein
MLCSRSIGQLSSQWEARIAITPSNFHLVIGDWDCVFIGKTRNSSYLINVLLRQSSTPKLSRS